MAIEFIDISRAVGVGFLVMGFIGFAVKLIHIPINNILVWRIHECADFRWGGRRFCGGGIESLEGRRCRQKRIE